MARANGEDASVEPDAARSQFAILLFYWEILVTRKIDKDFPIKIGFDSR